MSLIITVYVREGLVMAADSRLTLTIPRTVPGGQAHTLSLTASDSAKKLFLAPNNVGIATCGTADIGGVPIAGFVESFIVERLKPQPHTVHEVAHSLAAYMLSAGIGPNTVFHVAGYEALSSGALEQVLLQVNPAASQVVQLNPSGLQGANWNGEIDILQRLLNEVSLTQPSGQPSVALPAFGVPFEFFTLQDAIEFADFGIRSTIETLRFQAREKTVGGPVDVLVIRPDSAEWIRQKQLGTRP